AICDFVAYQKIRALYATEPVVSIGQIRRATVSVPNTRRIGQRLDLPPPNLTVVAVTDRTQDRRAYCLALDAPPRTSCRSHDLIHFKNIDSVLPILQLRGKFILQLRENGWIASWLNSKGLADSASRAQLQQRPRPCEKFSHSLV